ncbi:MAG: hypothetical protein ABIJ91_02925 [Candidatus Kuenenbacteria bacterium]
MKKQFRTLLFLIFLAISLFVFINRARAETNYQLNESQIQYEVNPLVFNEGDRMQITLKIKILSSDFDYTQIKAVYFEFYNHPDDIRFSFSKGILESDWDTNNREFTFDMMIDWSLTRNAKLIAINYNIRYQNIAYSIPINNGSELIVVPTVPFECTYYRYSNWSTCSVNGQQTRTLISAGPSGCSGGNPVLTQSCTYTPPICTSWTYSGWSLCSNDNQQTRSIISSSPSGCAGGNPVLTQGCTYVLPVCTSWTYSGWSICQSNGVQNRTVVSSSPSGCSGGNPALTQSCTYTPPICTSWTYSNWSTCVNGQQTRTITSLQPANCTGGSPILNQSCNSTPLCTENNWTSTLTPTNCPNNGQQTKKWTKVGECQGGISRSSEETVSCDYQVPTCTNFTYSDWGACSSSGVQSRTMLSTSPFGCAGGSPVLNKNCNYIVPCSSDIWSCGDWSNCSANGSQSRTCTKTFDCPDSQTESPITNQDCEIPNQNSQNESQANQIQNEPTLIKNNEQEVSQEKNITGSQVAEQRRSEVASAVQEILQVAERDSGVGQQVKIIAQTQAQNQEKLEASLQKVQNRSGLVKFFVGPNYEEINNAKNLLEQNREQIKQLDQIKNQLTNQDDQQKLTEQIQLFERSNQEIENSLDISQKGFSLFGWLFRLFTK